MRTLHVDGAAGLAGDMALGALVDLGVPLEVLREGLASLGLEDWELDSEPVTVNGFAATRVHVRVGGREELPPDLEAEAHDHGHAHDHDHAHGRTWPEIRALLEGAALAARVRDRALAVFRALCEAEAAVHGRSLDEVHLHEAGAVDALIDVVGTCLGLEHLGVERVTCAPPVLGSGTVRCAHGLLPVPPPAVLRLLEGRPALAGGPDVELTTPTGAALLAALSEDWNGLPPQRILGSGFGAGARRLPDRPNLARFTLGESLEPRSTGSVLVLEADLDDASPELVAAAAQRLRELGALDVGQLPVHGKKGRSGLRLSVLCREADREALVDALFEETPTIGCRWHRAERAECERETVEVATPYGRLPVKVARWKGRVVNRKPEHDACLAAARAHSVPLKSVLDAVSSALTREEEAP